MAHRVPITIRLERFEGPLDLLLYLIQSHELDISKISIAKITEQYVEYVRLMQELNFDVASDFLVMAATLIQWKSKALLPQEETAAGAEASEDDIMTPEELMKQLLEHQRFLEAGRELALRPMLGDDVFNRQITRAPTEKVWKNMEVTQLALTYQDLLVRERKRTQLLKKETVSLSTKIMDFADRLAVGKVTGMRSLLRDLKSRPETVVTFLASLELSRLRKMKVYQEGVYEEIYVELLESLKGFDTRLASGFDHLTEQVDKQIEAGTSVASSDFGKGSIYDAPGAFDSGSATERGTQEELDGDRAGSATLGGTEAELGGDRTSPAALSGTEALASGDAAGNPALAGSGLAAFDRGAHSLHSDSSGDSLDAGAPGLSPGASPLGADSADAAASGTLPGAESGPADESGVDERVAAALGADFDLAQFGEDQPGLTRVSGADHGTGIDPVAPGAPSDRDRGEFTGTLEP